MKKMRKILAMVMAFALVLGMTMTSMAAGTVVKPTETQTALATVKNVEANYETVDGQTENVVKVTAYQIVKGKYNNYGFIGYEAVTGVSLGSVTAPTSDEVTAIAKDIIDEKITLTSKSMTAVGTEDGLTNYTANLEAGYWVVLVSGTVDEIYNPILVGVYYSETTGSGSNSDLTTDGNADANANWTLVTKDAYAKSTAPTMDKYIVDEGGNPNTDGNVNGNDAAFGDIVYFKIDKMVVPSYSKEYNNVVVKITDSLSAGLTLKADSVKISADDTELTKDVDYTITTTAQTFEIILKSDYVLKLNADNELENAGKELVVTYNATVDTDATLNFKENTNTAKFIYTNDPKTGNTTEIEDKTYTYTFGIDALINGTGSKVTQELFKVNETGEVKIESEEVKVTNPLNGAKFKLTNTVTGKEYFAVSGDCNADGDYTDTDVDVAGALTFTGLDAGTYKMVETEAPVGYTINDTEYTVEISASYNTNGTLKDYSVIISSGEGEEKVEATSKYVATYDAGTTVISSIDEETLGATGIQNTKLIDLPSTGGIGTTIFTVAGCVIMIAAAFFFIVSRKKEEN